MPEDEGGAALSKQNNPTDPSSCSMEHGRDCIEASVLAASAGKGQFS